MKTQYQRRAKSITDEEVLCLLNFGCLKVTDLKNRQPTVSHHGRVKTPTLMGSDKQGGNGSRYRIEIRIPGKKRTIALAKLVWMSVHRRLVADECQIHHMDEDRYNDSSDNLEERHFVDHYEDHYGEF